MDTVGLEPPAPVQVIENVLFAVIAALLWVPEAARVPLPHAPEELQPVALAELHVSVVVLPLATAMGEAVSVTDGTMLTVTLAALLVPPAPVQVIENAAGALKAPVLFVPLLANEPLQAPEAVQLVASVELHVSVEAAPLSTLVGEALSVAVGAGELDPPPPPQPLRAIATLLPNRSIENRMIPQNVLCRSDAAGLGHIVRQG